jgi:hypothetical protein
LYSGIFMAPQKSLARKCVSLRIGSAPINE